MRVFLFGCLCLFIGCSGEDTKPPACVLTASVGNASPIATSTGMTDFSFVDVNIQIPQGCPRMILTSFTIRIRQTDTGTMNWCDNADCNWPYTHWRMYGFRAQTEGIAYPSPVEYVATGVYRTLPDGATSIPLSVDITLPMDLLTFRSVNDPASNVLEHVFASLSSESGTGGVYDVSVQSVDAFVATSEDVLFQISATDTRIDADIVDPSSRQLIINAP